MEALLLILDLVFMTLLAFAFGRADNENDAGLLGLFAYRDVFKEHSDSGSVEREKTHA